MTGPARKLGLDLAAYLARRERGEKWCWVCQTWHPVGAFAFDSSRADARNPVCRECCKTRNARRDRKK